MPKLSSKVLINIWLLVFSFGCISLAYTITFAHHGQDPYSNPPLFVLVSAFVLMTLAATKMAASLGYSTLLLYVIKQCRKPSRKMLVDIWTQDDYVLATNRLRSAAAVFLGSGTVLGIVAPFFTA